MRIEIDRTYQVDMFVDNWSTSYWTFLQSFDNLADAEKFAKEKTQKTSCETRIAIVDTPVNNSLQETWSFYKSFTESS